MISRTLQEYINKKPQEFILVEKSLDYLQKLLDSNLINSEIIKDNISFAERCAVDKTQPNFIAVVLLYNILFNYPDKQTEIESIIGKENIHPILSLNLLQKNINAIESMEKTKSIAHALNTARLLSKMQLDSTTITAGILHHIHKIQSDYDKIIREQFGDKIAGLLENYKKIDHFTNKNRNFNNKIREILLVMAQDVRVIFIKMASTIDSLKNYESILKEDRYIVAKLAKEILAPIADMLGVWHFRWQLEDQAFKILQSEEYEKIDKKFGQSGKRLRNKYINKLTKMVRREAQKKNIECEINGRFKHYYSIYRKMKTKQKTFNEIYDVFALRVILNNVDDCYMMLRIIHNLWPPINKRIKDYIAAPKENGYQTLHTTVIGPGNRLTEFQIRTNSMHQKALFGVAAQSIYKNQESDNDWTQKILRTGNLFSKKDVWEEELSKIFQEKIYVYSPKGDVVALPKGATPIDFAYQIHSELGHFCKFAIINNQPAELSKKLKNEDVIEIIPDINSEGPDPTWLKFVKTTLATKHINKFIKQKGLL